MAKSKQSEAYDLLEPFRNKAGACQSQDEANRIKSNLKPLLTEDEYFKLVIAHSHYYNGEGAAELYDVCNKLSEKYKK